MVLVGNVRISTLQAHTIRLQLCCSGRRFQLCWSSLRKVCRNYAKWIPVPIRESVQESLSKWDKKRLDVYLCIAENCHLNNHRTNERDKRFTGKVSAKGRSVRSIYATLRESNCLSAGVKSVRTGIKNPSARRVIVGDGEGKCLTG